MLYGCETWTINQQMMKRLEAENVILTGKIEGKRARGRPREMFLKSLTRRVGRGDTPIDLLRLTRDRRVWAFMTANVLRQGTN